MCSICILFVAYHFHITSLYFLDNKVLKIIAYAIKGLNKNKKIKLPHILVTTWQFLRISYSLKGIAANYMLPQVSSYMRSVHIDPLFVSQPERVTLCSKGHFRFLCQFIHIEACAYCFKRSLKKLPTNSIKN